MTSSLTEAESTATIRESVRTSLSHQMAKYAALSRYHALVSVLKDPSGNSKHDISDDAIPILFPLLVSYLENEGNLTAHDAHTPVAKGCPTFTGEDDLTFSEGQSFYQLGVVISANIIDKPAHLTISNSKVRYMMVEGSQSPGENRLPVFVAFSDKAAPEGLRFWDWCFLGYWSFKDDGKEVLVGEVGLE